MDFADDFFKRLKITSAQRGISMKELVRRALCRELAAGDQAPPAKRLKFPLLQSKHPASLKLTNAQIEEFLT